MGEHNETLVELYQLEGLKPPKPAPPTPKEEFVQMLADITASSAHTAKQWVLGNRKPSKIKQKIIAKHLKTTVKALFPDEDYN